MVICWLCHIYCSQPGPKFHSEMNIFHPHSRECPWNYLLTCRKSPLGDQILWLFWEVKIWTLEFGIWDEVCDSPCLIELAPKHILLHSWSGSGSKFARAQVFSLQKSLCIWHTPSSFSRSYIGKPSVPFPPRCKPQDHPLESFTTESQRFWTVTLLAFHTIVDTTTNLVVSLVTTLTVSTQRGRACLIHLWNVQEKYLGFLLYWNSLAMYFYPVFSRIEMSIQKWWIVISPLVCLLYMWCQVPPVCLKAAWPAFIFWALWCGVPNQKYARVFFHM